VTNGGPDNVSVLLNNGAGIFELDSIYPVGVGPRSVVSADFNCDGFVDLAVFNQNSDDCSILINNGDGSFRDGGSYPVGDQPYFGSSADYDNNGSPDLAVPNKGSNTVSILMNQLSMTLSVALDIKPGSCPNPLNIGRGDSGFWVYVDDELDIGSSNASSDAFAKAHPGKRRGVLPVAILGTDEFDVSEIDIASVMLEGVPVLRHNYEDVSTPVPDDADECECTDFGPDGFIDLTLKFDKNAVVDAIGEVNVGDVIPLTLTGELLDGTPVEGIDCVVIVGHDGPKFSQSGESLFELANYPNPFNPTTEISFNLPVMTNVRLDVYNIMGQKVTTLVDGPMQPGPHSVTWNGMSDSGESVASGMYFYRLEAGNYSESRKMLLLK
jgi:hypothetical protein